MGEILKIVFFILLLWPAMALAGEDEAVAFLNSGEFEAARKELVLLAENGDTKAMVTLGQLFYAGKFGQIDYPEAKDWWLKAYQADNADALSNIGVLYRDGLGVEQNLEIAYNIFLIVHMKGLGDQNTQIRNNGNLRKTMARMNQRQMRDALCQSEEYLYRFIETSEGTVDPPAAEEVRIKDKTWWLEGEVPAYECP